MDLLYAFGLLHFTKKSRPGWMSSAWDHPIEKHYKVDASLCHAAEIDGASTSPRGDPVELFGRPSYLPPILYMGGSRGFSASPYLFQLTR